MNLAKTAHFTREYLAAEDAARVVQRLEEIEQLIARRPRSIKWKLRAMIGERMQWYREVEEVDRG
jgi:hypothetical protein